MSSPVLVVVSGLAASGKTTLGRELSAGLSLPLLDKDEILEALFDSLGCDDREQRHRLSRASDEILFRLAADASSGAVVVNWWNHKTAPARLAAAAEHLVEIFCACPIEVAASRFAARERHPDHLDHLRSPQEHEEGIRYLRETYPGPLRLNGEPIVINTTRPVDVQKLLARVLGAIDSTGATAPSLRLDGLKGRRLLLGDEAPVGPQR